MGQANSFEHIAISGVKILARLAARKAVQAELKEAGVRVSLVKPAVINEQGTAYLAAHPELYEQAKPRIERMIAEKRMSLNQQVRLCRC